MFVSRFDPGQQSSQTITAQAKSLDQTRQRYLLVDGLLRELQVQIDNVSGGGQEMVPWSTLLRSLKAISSAFADLMSVSFPPSDILQIPNTNLSSPSTGAPVGPTTTSSKAASEPLGPPIIATSLTVPLNANTSLHVYPQGVFPGRTQGHILSTILRKRWSPSTITWADEAIDASNKLSDLSRRSGSGDPRVGPGLITLDQLVSLWDWAGPAGNAVAQSVLLEENEDEMSDDDEDEDEDEEYEEDADEDATMTDATPAAPARQPGPVENVMRMMWMGVSKQPE